MLNPLKSPPPLIADENLPSSSKKRSSRQEAFAANNAGVKTARVTHVLCCPDCSFMSLQEDTLAAHISARHSGVRGLPIYSCRLCQAASTQQDVMREHVDVYHGLSLLCQADSQLETRCLRVGSCPPPVGVSGPLTGSRKRKSNVPERIQCETEEAVPLKPPAGAEMPTEASKKTADASALCLLASSRSSNEASSLRASPSASPSSAGPSPAPTAGGGILDLSLKKASDPQQPHQLRQPIRNSQGHPQHPHKHNQSAKPQRQNFSEAQNSLLQRWFLAHRQKPYPSTADTRLLAEAAGLSYSQVKKWFANRRMRTKAPETDGDLQQPVPELPLFGSDSPVSWSASEVHAAEILNS